MQKLFFEIEDSNKTHHYIYASSKEEAFSIFVHEIVIKNPTMELESIDFISDSSRSDYSMSEEKIKSLGFNLLDLSESTYIRADYYFLPN